ncbi:oxygen-independent coproporphyrinogen III oxidase [Hyphomonas neptunium ATCC 15444]|uniref:Coproporphyrinogen-III oxidase n=2 Tax=Hyphomonas TaxID=85 RepID=Q0C4R0_HYPNA|nr:MULTISPECIES: oxygen-independent coproporphyrinogen III oxidase [Hyphomonas]ABI78443.1 oxygen-independent coproporphyrinogen III oxidase [Hyphomonas neptunium ATCC 15444]KCZ96504.1 coproporphyrinogen III oxidase [Hyphomonas hirschiana VP5]
MKDAWIPFAARAVPRYTSYPTAADFSPETGEAQLRAWMAAVAPGEPVSAYLHIPFCEKLCWYCGCATSVPNGYRRVGEYTDLLLKEISLKADAMGPHGGLAHLHFGGGSPNILSPADFLELADAMRRSFGLREGAEIAVELDPRTMQAGQVAAFARAGVNRASLGVQTLADDVQQAINRVQPREMVVALIEDLRGVGIGAINMDLMYGLPYQTTQHVAQAAQFAAEMGAARVSVFGYAHVPWFAKHQRAINENTLAGIRERFTQARVAAMTLEAAGYVAIGLDHYARADDALAIAARAGRLRRNFQGYTDDPCATLIGLGATAISQFREGFSQNCKDRKAWAGAIQAGRLPSERGIALTAEDRLRAHAIETLMCQLEVDVTAVCAAMGVADDSLDDALESARALEAVGLCYVSGSVITVPEEARIMLRTVGQCFDARSPALAQQRHAKAV